MKLDAKGLENGVVRLEPFQLAHVAHLEAAGAVESMWAYMPDIPKGKSANTYAAHILSQYESGLMVPFTMFRQSDDAFAGVVSYEMISKTHRRLRIANFWHPEEMRGSGVFQASQALLIQRALDWGARRIGWAVAKDAAAAVRAVKRLGAKEEGVLRSYYRLAGGGWADVVVLSMLREEAEMALQRLEIAADLAADAASGSSTFNTP
ncbi:MAG: GNAT family protein [Pseudomonadota bacterium]